MRNRDRRLIASIENSTRWVEERISRYPFLRRLGDRLQAHHAKIGKLVLEDYGSEKSQGQSGRELHRLMDRMRLEHMIRLARTGKKLLKFAPGGERIGRAPGTRATADEVVKAARRMHKAAKPHRAYLIDVGFEDDFFARFKNDTDELARMSATWDAARKRRTLMLRELDAEVRAARGVIDVMDGMLMPHLKPRANHSDAFMWKQARRVPGKLGRPKKKKVLAPV